MAAETQARTTLTQSVQAPRASVFEAFTTATRLCEWFSYDAQLEAAPGGRFYAYWREPGFYAVGEYLEVRAPELIRLRWSDKDNPQPVEVEIAFAESEGGTEVSVHHPAMPAALEPLWRRALAVLASTQERGYHLDLLERPMLGVLLSGDVTAENAGQYGVPVAYGAALQGTLAGLSAEAAGLRQGDVIVGMDGKEVRTVQDIPPITRQHKAGDTVVVEFYRGAERHAVPMELRPRNLHPYPESLEDLARTMAREKERLIGELRALLAGATDAEAERAPAPGKWNAKQILAHLVASERESQAFIASLAVGNELEVFTANLDARVNALVRRYPTLAALVQALEDAYAETLEIVRGLPQDFLARKASVVRVQLAAEADPFHVRHHFGQVRRALEAARQAA
ncbi:SRPBCC domain-containing protein [Calidithermus chliarophilus]|uniref:SRPBCC domain-containing protein n=1 Tax=Calidithermus chliarophilus TaxID=52023 RepID=UPI00041C87EB|nr:SRPBCC domain-containing protein [Calidithermus chliarophilus]